MSFEVQKKPAKAKGAQQEPGLPGAAHAGAALQGKSYADAAAQLRPKPAQAPAAQPDDMAAAGDKGLAPLASGPAIERAARWVHMATPVEQTWKLLLPYLPASAYLACALLTEQSYAAFINGQIEDLGGFLSDKHLAQASMVKKGQWLQEHGGLRVDHKNPTLCAGRGLVIAGASLTEITMAAQKCKNEQPAARIHNSVHSPDQRSVEVRVWG